jgi:hypothetical protein
MLDVRGSAGAAASVGSGGLPSCDPTLAGKLGVCGRFGAPGGGGGGVCFGCASELLPKTMLQTKTASSAFDIRLRQPGYGVVVKLVSRQKETGVHSSVRRQLAMSQYSDGRRTESNQHRNASL